MSCNVARGMTYEVRPVCVALAPQQVLNLLPRQLAVVMKPPL